MIEFILAAGFLTLILWGVFTLLPLPLAIVVTVIVLALS